MSRKKVIEIGDASIPLDAYAIGGTAVLGIRGSGKTYSAKGIAEQLLEHRVPIIVFDPIGVWRHLKVPGGKDGKDYPVVVAGGRGADLPLTPASAQEIVRAAMRENISLVIDLYDKALSKADWRRIVQTCFRTLLYENEGVRHIILEEAAEYVPQKVMDGETYAEVEKLVRMGGNTSLGITLINQRAQEVNKAVLDLCENLVLMRQMGAHAIDALEKWIDKVSPDFAGKIAAGMPKMQAGEAWVFAGGAEKPVHTRSRTIRTYHPDRKNPDAKVIAAATDTTAFVAALQRALPAIVEQQNANDPKRLKARVAELEGMLRKAVESGSSQINTAVLGEQSQQITELMHSVRELEQHRDAIASRYDEIHRWCISAFDLHEKALDQHREQLKSIPLLPIPFPSAPPAPPPHPKIPRQPVSVTRESAVAATPGNLKEAQFKILRAFWWLQDENATPAKVMFYAGYAQSGYTDRLLGQLRSMSLVAGWKITDAGRAAMAGRAEPKPSGMELREWLREQLNDAQNRMLDVLVAARGARLSDEQISKGSGIAQSGYFDRIIGKLRTLEAAEGGARVGGTKAADVFFE